MAWPVPNEQNHYHWSHVRHLLRSYERFLGKPLLEAGGYEKLRLEERLLAQQLFYAPFAVVSHGTESDPVFNYANQTALSVFAMDWGEFTSMLSKYSAEPVSREERASLLARVTRNNFIDDYQGVRIAKSGARFLINQATVWNVVDCEKAKVLGQAAVFFHWQYL